LFFADCGGGGCVDGEEVLRLGAGTGG
jgi:hypothetical protein